MERESYWRSRRRATFHFLARVRIGSNPSRLAIFPSFRFLLVVSRHLLCEIGDLLKFSPFEDEFSHHDSIFVMWNHLFNEQTIELLAFSPDAVAYHPENDSLLPSATDQRVPDDTDPWASDVYATAGETFEMTFEEEGIYDYPV